MQNASSMRGSAGGSASGGNALLGMLDNATLPIVAVVAIVVVLLVVIAFSARLCSSAGPAEETEQPDEAQQEEVDPSAIPEELLWRDADFAVSPSKTTWSTNDNGRKVVYLTIDDGPSDLTEQFLDVLDEYDCKATFFVTGHDPQYYDMIHEAYRRGHTIGLHSMTHDYATVYASEEAFFKDLDDVGKVVEQQIGYVPCFIRFPGGSSNGMADQYSKGLMKTLVREVQARGYQYYDWSLSTGDGDGDLTVKEIVSESTTSDAGEGGYDPTADTNIVLLCHDSATKETTLEALPKIIEYYQGKGYSFEAIDRSTWVCHHYLVDSTSSTEDEDGSSDDGDGQSDADEYDEWSEEGEDSGITEDAEV